MNYPSDAFEASDGLYERACSSSPGPRVDGSCPPRPRGQTGSRTGLLLKGERGPPRRRRPVRKDSAALFALNKNQGV